MITRLLECALDDEDVLYRGQRLANAEHDWEEIYREKKSANEEFKKRMEAVEGRISELAQAVRTRVEWRDVECTIRVNHQKLIHEVVRMDVEEIVETIPFTEKERQGVLDGFTS